MSADCDIEIKPCSDCKGLGNRGQVVVGYRLVGEDLRPVHLDVSCTACNNTGKVEVETYHHG